MLGVGSIVLIVHAIKRDVFLRLKARLDIDPCAFYFDKLHVFEIRGELN